MLQWVQERRKLVVFAIGFVLSALNEAGVTAIADVDSGTQAIVTAVIAVLTLFVAERVPNDPVAPRRDTNGTTVGSPWVVGLFACVLLLAGCASLDREDGAPFYGDDVAAIAIGVDGANEAAILIVEAANISTDGVSLIVNASSATVASLVELDALNDAYRAGTTTSYDVVGAVTSTLRTLPTLYALTEIDGSPFSGQDWAVIVGSLFASSYPEMDDLRAAIRDAEAAGEVLDPAIVQLFVDNAIGSNARLRAAAEAHLTATEGG